MQCLGSADMSLSSRMRASSPLFLHACELFNLQVRCMLRPMSFVACAGLAGGYRILVPYALQRPLPAVFHGAEDGLNQPGMLCNSAGFHIASHVLRCGGGAAHPVAQLRDNALVR